jgi:hypothetical protein
MKGDMTWEIVLSQLSPYKESSGTIDGRGSPIVKYPLYWVAGRLVPVQSGYMALAGSGSDP